MKKGNKGDKIILFCIGLNLLFGLIDWYEYYPESFDKMANHIKSLGRKVKEKFHNNNKKEEEQ